MNKKLKLVLGLLMFFMLLSPSSMASPQGDNVVIQQVLYDVEGDEDGEWILLYNPSSITINMSNWRITDQEEILKFPIGTKLEPNSTLLVVRSGEVFLQHNPEITPDYEMKSTVEEVPDLIPVKGYALHLNNGGDEIILRDSSEEDVDVVVYENGYYAHEGWGEAAPEAKTGQTLFRKPYGMDSDQCNLDFVVLNSSEVLYPPPATISVSEFPGFIVALSSAFLPLIITLFSQH